MGSKVVGQRDFLDDFGISLSKRGQPRITVRQSSESNSEKFDIVYDLEAKQWVVASPNLKPIANGSIADSSTPKHSSPKSKTTWVDQLPDTDHVQDFRSLNWSATPLGSLESWPVSLQTLVNFVMAESMPAAIYWGPQLCGIYNAELIKMYRTRLSKSDQYMGKAFKEVWPDVWATYESMLMEVIENGVPLDTLDLNLFPIRNGITEETFWTGSFLPLRDLSGKIQGFFNRGRETTREIITERRTKTLNAIALPPSVEGNFVWEHLFNAFRDNDREFPMAFVYRATTEANSGVKFQLEQSIGLPETGHPLVPQELELFEGQSGFVPYFRRAKAADRPLLLHKANKTLPDVLVKDFEWKGFGEPSTSVAIMAIHASDRLLGMLVVGLNPRRPYDIDYEGFLNSLARHTSATITNAIDKEEAKLRALRLSEQLEVSERQIRELAVHGPVGMVQVALNGTIQWANDQFYELTGHSPSEEHQYEMSFLDLVHSDDVETSAGAWVTSIETLRPTTVALRLKRTWTPPIASDEQESKQEPVWVSAATHPVFEDGELKYIAAVISDISHYKWAEAIESRNAAAAKEAKRLQENFIDIVSHEMRNPLSAITQLADGISSSFEHLEGSTDYEQVEAVINDNVESANTILLCAAHQKRIIDDVLTLSKLDSMMLSITPVVVQPYKIVESALKMFEGEFHTNDIKFHSHLDSSYAEIDVDWVTVDPSRLTQIFINLITNAIKFTRLEERREIRVKTSAALSRPPTIAGVTWFPTHKEYRDLTQSKEWGTGQEIFLCFEVQDTGRGLEQEEMTKLFTRFQQATAKTHIKYGGSGLGLFISRELTETQGGEIGVVSEPGKGSTFAFYIKGRRAEPPDKPAAVHSQPPINPTSPQEMLRRKPSADQQSINSAHSSDEGPSAKPVILLVEDNVVNAKVLTKQLERAKCVVHSANHGMEAIDFLSRTRSWKGLSDDDQVIDIDCVLMDMEMPIMDGLTCTRRIRQLQEEGLLLKHINIIAITANARQEQTTTLKAAGADDVMPKPFRVRELLAMIDEVRSRDSMKET